MLKINLPLAHRNPLFKAGARITIELAAVIQRPVPSTKISWKSVNVSIPYLTNTGEQILSAGIPDGECVILPRRAVFPLLKYDITVPDEVGETRPYPTQALVFNNLGGYLQVKREEEAPLMFKWRFTLKENDVSSVSPWSSCYKAQTGCQQITGKEADREKTDGENNVITLSQSLIPKEEDYDLRLFCRSSCDAFVLGTNLDFVLGIGNQGNRECRDIILQAVIKPTAGVELEIVSMEEAGVIDPSCLIITAQNPVVFTYYHSKVPPRTEYLHHIIVRTIAAPLGVSLVEGSVRMFVDKSETRSEKCTAIIKISPPPDIRETQKNILSSLARAEAGMADILLAEADKISKASHLASDVLEITKVNDSVQDTLRNLIKYQILQEFRLEDALKMDKR